MTMNGRSLFLSTLLGIGTALGAFAQSSTYSPQLFSDMRWRRDWPHARRQNARSGRSSEPARNLLPWRREWRRLEDHRRRARPGTACGTISPPARSAPSPSPTRDPNIVYVGSGEGLARPDLSTGDGVYKSTDAGKTWSHLRPARRPADRSDRDRPKESQSRLRCGHRPSLRPQRGARTLSHH